MNIRAGLPILKTVNVGLADPWMEMTVLSVPSFTSKLVSLFVPWAWPMDAVVQISPTMAPTISSRVPRRALIERAMSVDRVLKESEYSGGYAESGGVEFFAHAMPVWTQMRVSSQKWPHFRQIAPQERFERDLQKRSDPLFLGFETICLGNVMFAEDARSNGSRGHQRSVEILGLMGLICLFGRICRVRIVF